MNPQTFILFLELVQLLGIVDQLFRSENGKEYFEQKCGQGLQAIFMALKLT
jgi:hypothetical protein